MFKFLTYRKLKTKKWNKMPASKRLKVFQKIEKFVAKSQKRETFTIQPKAWDKSTLGNCSYSRHTIGLNDKYFVQDNLQFLGLATLFHEERHIYQHERVAKKTKKNKKIHKFSKTYKWQQEMAFYIDYDGTDKYSYYSMQDVERDANKFAIRKLQDLEFMFKKDANFINALEERMLDYSETKKTAIKELGFFYKIKLYFKRKFKDR